MTYKIKIHKKVIKGLNKLPDFVGEKFFVLVENLREQGPIQTNWPNFSKLGKNQYHCHLNRSWVACWKYEKKTIIIEVEYVGSREKAPY